MELRKQRVEEALAELKVLEHSLKTINQIYSQEGVSESIADYLQNWVIKVRTALRQVQE